MSSRYYCNLRHNTDLFDVLKSCHPIFIFQQQQNLPQLFTTKQLAYPTHLSTVPTPPGKNSERYLSYMSWQAAGGV